VQHGFEFAPQHQHRGGLNGSSNPFIFDEVTHAPFAFLADWHFK